jgi:predicted NAD/FAD-binding protein
MNKYSLICIGSDIYLHRDKNLMPQNQAAWSAWNFLGSNNYKVCVAYWLNILQVDNIAAIRNACCIAI